MSLKIPIFKYYNLHLYVVQRNRLEVQFYFSILFPGPLIVCLHGGGFSALTWAMFSRHLVEAAQCQVLAIDQRGHGR